MTGSCSRTTDCERPLPNMAVKTARLEKHGINYDYYTTNMYFQRSKFRNIRKIQRIACSIQG
jgi:hypothetical protein